MTHASDSSPAPSGRTAAWWGLAAVVGLLAVLPLDSRLRGTAAPNGIVSYELAGTPERAQAMLAQWAGDAVTGVAKVMMGIDVVYPALYGAALVVALRWAAARAGRPRAGRALSLLAIGAAAADYVENAALIWQLWADRATTFSAGLAAGAAWVKFALITLSLVAILVLALRRRRARSAEGPVG